MANKYTYLIPFTKEELKKNYEQGMTQVEIAAKYGTTQKVVFRAMRNFGIKARIPTKRNQNGQNNSSWKGDAALYGSFHQRVKYARGKAKNYICSVCGTKNKSLNYDWANLTGNYGDVNDYAPMCRPCHRKFDKRKVGDCVCRQEK
jgi:hypothetical protein